VSPRKKKWVKLRRFSKSNKSSLMLWSMSSITIALLPNLRTITSYVLIGKATKVFSKKSSG